MLTVDTIVKVSISRETVSKTVRDLQTIAILSRHAVFTDAYRVYTDTDALLEDGFKTTDFAYIASKRIFDQNPQVSKVVVGRTADSDTIDYTAEILALTASTNAWFFLITDAKDDADKIAIASYVEDKQMFYIYSDSNPLTLDKANTSDVPSILKARSYTKNACLYTKKTDLVAPEAGWAGRFASAIIGSNLWVYKTIVGLEAESFTSDEYTTLLSKNVQVYTKVGEDSVITGNAVTGAGEKIHVILGAIWLEVRIG